MKTIFDIQYFNKTWADICIIIIVLVLIIIFSRVIVSFFVNLRCAVLKNQNESNDIKKSYLFICRLIPLIAIIIVVGIYICNLIPVLQYKLNDKYEHINGIVENFEKDGKIERFTVNGVYFQTFSNEIQLTYSGGLIREGMQVDIEYYNDSSINRIFKITIHEN